MTLVANVSSHWLYEAQPITNGHSVRMGVEFSYPEGRCRPAR